MTDNSKSFGKASLILLLLAGLAFGGLIGGGLANNIDVNVAGLASGTPAPLDRGGAPVFRYLDVGDVTLVKDEFDIALPAVDGENFIGRETLLKSETLIIELAGDEAIEYKAMMKQGDSIVFRWVAEGGPIYYDFHAHDASFGPEFFTRYDEGEGSSRAGSIVASYDGQHGWYWLNTNSERLMITLDVAGFYGELVKVGD